MKDNNITLLDYNFTTDRHHCAIMLLSISGFNHIINDHTVSKKILMHNYTTYDKIIHKSCDVFKKSPPIIRSNVKIINMAELIFNTKLKCINKILNEWYAYRILKVGKLSKSDNDEEIEYKLVSTHKFAISQNDMERILVPSHVPIIDYDCDNDLEF